MCEIKLISGNSFSDQRGKISFINDISLKSIKRFYIIEHPDTTVIRAWQGHQYEEKYFYVVKGSFQFVFINPKDFKSPDANEMAVQYRLSSTHPEAIMLPERFISGFKALEINSVLLVFSNKELSESENDDFRWELNYFKNGAKLFKI